MGTLNTTLTFTQYTGTNTFKLGLYKNSDPNVEVAAQYAPAGPFTNYQFYFVGLDPVYYQVKAFEVDNDDHSHILAAYGTYTIFMPQNQTIEYKNGVEWVAGSTLMADGETVFPANVSSFTNADWAGWDVEDFQQFSNFFSRIADFAYDSSTGTLVKTQDGDTFVSGSRYKVTFRPKISNVSSATNFTFAGKRFVTGEDGPEALTAGDVGKIIIVKPVANYLEIALPSLNDVPELQPIYIRMAASDTVKCGKFKALSGQVIDFGKGNKIAQCIYPTEKFTLYKEIDENDVSKWTIIDAVGNFLTVGETVSDEGNADTVINKTAKDGGGTGLSKDVYARLYEEIVENLPSDQVVPYANWSGADINGVPNKYKFSYAHPSTGLFHIPDTRDVFERQTGSSRSANTFQKNALKDHRHALPVGALEENGETVFGSAGITSNIGQYNGRGNHKKDLTSDPYTLASPGGYVEQEASTETTVDNVAVNRWLRY